MSKRFSILLVILTIVSGLIGGLISGRIFAVNPAQAVEAKQDKVLTTEELRIVDSSGKLLMLLGKVRDKDKKVFDEHGIFIFGKDDKPKATVSVDGLVTDDEFEGFGGVRVSGEKSEAELYEDSFTVYSSKDHIPRATIKADETDSVILISTQDGNVSAMMNATETDSVISVSKSKDGSPAVAMGATGEFGSGVYVYGKDDEVRASMSLVEDMSIVGVSGKNGDKTASMQALENTCAVGVTGKDNKSGAIMQTNDTGGVVNVFGEDGKQPRVSIQVNKLGSGAIGLWDKNGKRLK